MRPSKLRLPDRTDATTRSFCSTAPAIDSGSGPLLPMQVSRPRPVVGKPSLSRYWLRPDLSKYSVTTRLPGERLVLTYGLTLSPCSTAFFASSPAAIITDGLLVLVQLVMAAMVTSPWVSLCHRSSSET